MPAFPFGETRAVDTPRCRCVYTAAGDPSRLSVGLGTRMVPLTKEEFTPPCEASLAHTVVTDTLVTSPP
jgi:hypothetical protein